MAPHDGDNLRTRPRANTTTAFTSFTAWRKGKSETSSTTSATTTATGPSTAPLSVDELIQSLIPPAVPGLANARTLASALCTYSPLPRHTALIPVLGVLCASDAPVPLQAAGFDILSAYWENGEAKSLELADRMSYFALFTGQQQSSASSSSSSVVGGGAGTAWSMELWEPKFKALRAITKFGMEILGIEVQFFNVLKTWILDAFERLFTLEPNERDERAERERSIEILSGFLNSVVEKPEVAARLREDEVEGILEFYGKMVERAIDVPSAIPPPVSSPSMTHHRQHSSISLASLPSPTVSSPPPSIASQQQQSPAKQPVDIAVTLYITHLNKQLKQLPPSSLSVILPLLFRALASSASPLPRLSVTAPSRSTPKRSYAEDRIGEVLNSLLSGPYSSTCLRILQRNLYPPKLGSLDMPTPPSTPPPLPSQKSIQKSIQTSFGALRTLREYLRRTLITRLARAYISKESAVGYSHSGVPTHLDLSGFVMERAWPKAEPISHSFSQSPRSPHTPRSTSSQSHSQSILSLSSASANGWEAARFRKSLAGSTRAWVEFGLGVGFGDVLDSGGGPSVPQNTTTATSPPAVAAVVSEEGLPWIKEGKERILEEVAGILKDVVHELKSRDDEDVRLDEDEARTVGETLFQLAGYVLLLRNPDGTRYLMPLSQPLSAETPFLQSLCYLLSPDQHYHSHHQYHQHAQNTMMLSPRLSTTLLHISSHLFDSDASKLPILMRDKLSPASPDWLESWKEVLESPLTMSAGKVGTRKEVMRVLERVYEDVKDLRG